MTASKLTRRGFIAGVGAAGLGSLASSSLAQGQTTASAPVKLDNVKMPTRAFGRDKIELPILALGGIFDILNNQIMLKKALDWGITYWDTANGYVGGNSELGIGKFFEKFPEVRKKVFLVTKSSGRDPKKLTEHLNLSFERMKTDYVNLFFFHGIKSTQELTPEAKDWAAKMKAEKKIRMVGFSTHSNMEDLLAAAPGLGWIDGIMLTYNFINMQSDAMKRGIDACHKAGIGLTAMKTLGKLSKNPNPEEQKKFIGHFIEKGFTPQQAGLKAVWSNDMITSICSQMDNLTNMQANVAAACDKTQLAMEDIKAFERYASAVASSYCTGCRSVCSAHNGDHVGEVMRLMMYHTSYGDTHRARQMFAELPAEVREQLDRGDYSAAERACPQGMPIAEIMREAKQVLA